MTLGVIYKDCEDIKVPDDRIDGETGVSCGEYAACEVREMGITEVVNVVVHSNRNVGVHC